MASSKSALGRGLGAIFDEITETYEDEFPTDSGYIKIDVSAIRPNPYQPRKTFDQVAIEELSESIATYGLLQPIVVVEDIDGYVLVAGERRLRATKYLGHDEIKAIVSDVNIESLRELAIIENIQRENLNPIELANSYYELLQEHGLTHDELASRVHKSRAQITNTLRLLTLSETVKQALLHEKISQGHAKVLVGVSEENQDILVESIIGQKLSVREVEQIVRQLKDKPKQKESVPSKISPKLVELPSKQIDKILQSFDLSYKINKNKLTLEFTSDEQIEAFLNNLSLS
jgi:ParB family chromosome partitioning protein